MKQPTSAPKKLTITTSVWRVPSEERAFDGWMEGAPNAEERERTLEKVRVERAAWKPGKAEHEIVEQLCAFVGLRVRIQMWDPIMRWDEREGPDPFHAVLLDVVVQDASGFPQAYLVLDELTPARFDGGVPEFAPRSKGQPGYLAPVAELYEVEVAVHKANERPKRAQPKGSRRPTR